MTTRLRFGLDIDGVVYQFDPLARHLLRSSFGLDMSPHSIHWDSIKNEAGPEAWGWLWAENGGLRMLFAYGEPYPGARMAVQKIAELADIVIITSVPGNAVYDRVDWLMRHYIPCSELHVTMQPKHLIQPVCDVYLDDGPHNIEAIRNHTSSTILLWNQPWNQEVYTDAQVIRVSDWQAVIDKVKVLSER